MRDVLSRGKENGPIQSPYPEILVQTAFLTSSDARVETEESRTSSTASGTLI